MKFGPRFYDWQLAQITITYNSEVEVHAYNLDGTPQKTACERESSADEIDRRTASTNGGKDPYKDAARSTSHDKAAISTDGQGDLFD